MISPASSKTQNATRNYNYIRRVLRAAVQILIVHLYCVFVSLQSMFSLSEVHLDYITSLTWHSAPTSTFCVSASWDKTVKVWNLE